MRCTRKRKPTESSGKLPFWKLKAFTAEPATQQHCVKRLGKFGPASKGRSLATDPVAVAEAFASMRKAMQQRR